MLLRDSIKGNFERINLPSNSLDLWLDEMIRLFRKSTYDCQDLVERPTLSQHCEFFQSSFSNVWSRFQQQDEMKKMAEHNISLR